MRGEYNILAVLADVNTGSPPLARGVRATGEVTVATSRITPACAGSTLTTPTMSTRQRDHPRLRGEYKDKETLGNITIGSPPLARGVPV